MHILRARVEPPSFPSFWFPGRLEELVCPEDNKLLKPSSLR